MTLTMMLLLAAAIVLPLVWIARRHSTGKTVKKPLIAHCFSFFALVAAATVFGFVYSGSAMAADTATAAAPPPNHWRTLSPTYPTTGTWQGPELPSSLRRSSL